MGKRSDNHFEVKLGRIRSASGEKRVTGFLKQVGRKAGRASTRHRSGGGRQQRQSRSQFHRRVIVKVSIVKMEGRGAGAQRQHLNYIERDSAAPDGERGNLYSERGQEVEGKAFAERGVDDRHQFRVIVSPEDAGELADIKAFTRDLVEQMETDLGTKLDWVAADHYDTGQPHTHLVIRGKRDDGTDLVMPKDYVSKGIRERAQELVTIELGPVPEIEGRTRMARMVRQQRLTQIDRRLFRSAQDRIVDVSAPAPKGRVWLKQLHRARLKSLEKMGLAEPLGKGRWRINENAEQTLKRMGERGDIIKTMHRAMAGRDQRLIDGTSLYDPGADGAKPVTGKILALGVGDDIADRAYLVIDDLDGKSRYVNLGPSDRLADFSPGMIVTVHPANQQPRSSDRTIDQIASQNRGRYSQVLHMETDTTARPEFVAAHVRRLEAMRRAGCVERRPDGSWTIPPDYLTQAGEHERASALSRPVSVSTNSSLSLKQMKTAIGATWLDKSMVEGEANPFTRGFGGEVERAKAVRRTFLFESGVLKNKNVQLTGTHLAELERRDLANAGQRLVSEMGKPYSASPASGHIKGIYAKAIDRPSGKYAVIERAKDFTLVPWREVLERQRGKSVSGLLRGKTISWSFGRGRGVT
jgi:type IV secretory pathway VirD2 relaxase